MAAPAYPPTARVPRIFVERRTEQRIPCTPLRTTLTLKESGEAVNIEVLNVSAAGLGLRAWQPLSVGARARVALQSSAIDGWICHCRPVSDGAYDLGLLIGRAARSVVNS